MDDVQRAEDYGNQRAAICMMMAVVLLLSAGFALKTGAQGDAQHAFGIPVYVYRSFITLGGGLLIATGGALFRRSSVARLANDESTRDHRRHSMAVGFWVVLAIGLGGYLATFQPWAPSARLLSRLVIDGGVAAALLTFAGLEMRAAR